MTGTFHLDSLDVVRLGVAGLRDPVEVTGNHPVFSEDHQDYVTAKSLRVGGRLRRADGTTATVTSLTKLPGRWTVYNLEVEGAHQYYVTDLDLLVHNAGPNGGLGNGGGSSQGVPNDIQGTLDRIGRGENFPHRNDGSVFGNREGLLPSQPPGYYREYVHPTPGVRGPGPQRVVIGQGGERHYTPNHYRSFFPF